jgi:hypothetical protein
MKEHKRGMDLSRAVSLGVSLVVHMNIGRRAAATATLPFGRCGGRFIGGVARSPVARGTPWGKAGRRIVGCRSIVGCRRIVGCRLEKRGALGEEGAKAVRAAQR